MFFNAFLSERLFVRRGSAGSTMIGGETCKDARTKRFFRREPSQSLVRNTNDAMINWSPVISSSWEIIRNFEHNSAHFEVRKVNWQSGDGVKARLLLLSFKLISGRDKIKFFCSSAFDNSLLGKMVGASGCQLMFIWNQFGCKRIQCPRTSFKVILFGLTRNSKKF